VREPLGEPRAHSHSARPASPLAHAASFPKCRLPSLHLEAGHLEAGHLEAGHLEAGHLEAGHLEAGHLEAGHLEAGHLPRPLPLPLPAVTSLLSVLLAAVPTAVLATADSCPIPSLNLEHVHGESVDGLSKGATSVIKACMDASSHMPPQFDVSFPSNKAARARARPGSRGRLEGAAAVAHPMQVAPPLPSRPRTARAQPALTRSDARTHAHTHTHTQMDLPEAVS
jgi:hypothetical protein